LENVGRVSSSERRRPPRYTRRIEKAEREFKRGQQLLIVQIGQGATRSKGTGRVPLDKVEGFVKGRDVLSGE
jgi:hypothetical protein